jgi:uncharacterized membrane protein HdeD (DUF308 family)
MRWTWAIFFGSFLLLSGVFSAIEGLRFREQVLTLSFLSYMAFSLKLALSPLIFAFGLTLVVIGVIQGVKE